MILCSMVYWPTHPSMIPGFFHHWTTEEASHGHSVAQGLLKISVAFGSIRCGSHADKKVWCHWYIGSRLCHVCSFQPRSLDTWLVGTTCFVVAENRELGADNHMLKSPSTETHFFHVISIKQVRLNKKIMYFVGHWRVSAQHAPTLGLQPMLPTRQGVPCCRFGAQPKGERPSD